MYAFSEVMWNLKISDFKSPAKTSETLYCKVIVGTTENMFVFFTTHKESVRIQASVTEVQCQNATWGPRKAVSPHLLSASWSSSPLLPTLHISIGHHAAFSLDFDRYNFLGCSQPCVSSFNWQTFGSIWAKTAVVLKMWTFFSLLFYTKQSIRAI